MGASTAVLHCAVLAYRAGRALFLVVLLGRGLLTICHVLLLSVARAQGSVKGLSRSEARCVSIHTVRDTQEQGRERRMYKQ